MNPDWTLLVIGAGNMGGALIEALLRARVVSPARLAIAEPDEARCKVWQEREIAAFPKALTAIGWLRRHEPETGAGQVMLAVKPQMLASLAAEIAPGWEGPRTVISILAGTPTARVMGLLPGSRVVRAMPNLPAKLGEGCTALCRGEGVTPDDAALARAIFEAAGPEVVQIPEAMLDAFTALAGSGPAYVFYLAEAMERAAAEMGFEARAARRIVRQTLLGAARMLDETDPAGQRTAVTSKGGTTQAATTVLDEAGVQAAFVRAILAGRDRGGELAKMQGE
jgi:pyrroline-5-carboxylate reductase